tara:strand:- start:2565 stop:3926 length:1362 start_codon:yes stop_codon:yes gene_type:complete
MKKLNKIIKEMREEMNSNVKFGKVLELPRDFFDGLNDDDDTDGEYLSNSVTEDISFVELAIINGYLHDVYRGKHEGIEISGYGKTDNLGRVSFGGTFDITQTYWFLTKFTDADKIIIAEKKETDIVGDNKEENAIKDNLYIFQTTMYLDGRGELNTQLTISTKKGVNNDTFASLLKTIKSLAFNNSEFKGKCIKVKLDNSSFRGIEIIDIKEASNELILNETQHKFIDHFITRVSRGGNARYLLNGEAGTGKTESIREIARKLIPNVTFVIPEFKTTDDLTSIMEACEIFENAVIVMDDIDLYLGNREQGHYTNLLGQFLSFFDGVKKRKISLLASTNDKGLVDKAAERPGRFNFTLDYSFLDDEQIVKVCDIHLPEKWRIAEVYEALKGSVGGKKAKITGAFIANLADNIREMSEDEENWSVEDTVSLIQESYKGFYSSQVEKDKSTLGFTN